MSHVTDFPVANPAAATNHFASLLSFETDCWDVHASLDEGDFVLLDVRGTELFKKGHIRTAMSLPHLAISEKRLASLPQNSLFVIYCAGPHCNGADKAALKLAAHGKSVKKMIGGVCGWLDEGFQLESD